MSSVRREICRSISFGLILTHLKADSALGIESAMNNILSLPFPRGLRALYQRENELIDRYKNSSAPELPT